MSPSSAHPVCYPKNREIRDHGQKVCQTCSWSNGCIPMLRSSKNLGPGVTELQWLFDYAVKRPFIFYTFLALLDRVSRDNTVTQFLSQCNETFVWNFVCRCLPKTYLPYFFFTFVKIIENLYFLHMWPYNYIVAHGKKGKLQLEREWNLGLVVISRTSMRGTFDLVVVNIILELFSDLWLDWHATRLIGLIFDTLWC